LKSNLAIIILTLFAVFAACSKAAGPANGNSIQPNNRIDSLVSMNAQVNAALWQTDSAFAYVARQEQNDSPEVNLMISATNYSNSVPTTISFAVNNYTGANTYQINPPFTAAYYYIGSRRFAATSGQLVITVNQIVVKSVSGFDTGYSLNGTFNFDADTLHVTNGVFNVAAP
jgi:hypothetical protein